MTNRRNIWTLAIVALVGLAVFGIVVTVSIISREGVDGLFKRKRKAVEKVMPDAAPMVDEVEKRVPR